MAYRRRVPWLLVSLLAANVPACGGKAHSPNAPGGSAAPGAAGSAGDGAAEPAAQQGGAGGAAAVGEAGSAGSGSAGFSATGSAGSGYALPTPSPCAFDADVDGDLQRCSNGLLHRPAGVSCPSLLPLPDPVLPGVVDIPDASYPFDCRRDSDCTAQPYGHCSAEVSLPHCEYGCVVDGDCPRNQLCSCQSYGGRCIPGSCRTDGDCTQGRLCGSDTSCAGTQFACQTALDQCAGDGDCPAVLRCTLEPSDDSNPQSFLRRVCRERSSCADSARAQ